MVFGRNNDYPPQQQRSPFRGRLIAAIIIAVIGWLMYMGQVEKNPVTGERQHVAISPSQEIKLGLESAPQMSREMGGELSSSDPRAKEVQSIGQYLVNHSIAQKSPWKFQFHLLADTETVNAFALPGGQIFITLGLYDKLENEAELAGVLGHEMGHVIERHTAEQMAKNQLGQTLIIAVNSTQDSYGGYGQTGMYSPAIIASVVNQMFQLHYSREDESEADTWGLKVMVEAGFNPEAMLKVMAVLKAAGGSRGGMPEIFQTHPNPDLRMEQIKAYLKEHPPAAGLSYGRKLRQ